MNKHQNYAASNNNPYITASHQAAFKLIVHVSVKVLLGLGRLLLKVAWDMHSYVSMTLALVI